MVDGQWSRGNKTGEVGERRIWGGENSFKTHLSGFSFHSISSFIKIPGLCK